MSKNNAFYSTERVLGFAPGTLKSALKLSIYTLCALFLTVYLKRDQSGSLKKRHFVNFDPIGHSRSLFFAIGCRQTRSNFMELSRVAHFREGVQCSQVARLKTGSPV